LRGVCNLAWPAFTLTTPFLVAHRYQHGVGGYGLVLAAFGGGNLIGTVFSARVADRWLFRTCCLAWAGAGLEPWSTAVVSLREADLGQHFE
jgi:MFS family permease